MELNVPDKSSHNQGGNKKGKVKFPDFSRKKINTFTDKKSKRRQGDFSGDNRF